MEIKHVKNIVVYSTPTCHFCEEAKKLITEKGYTFTNYDVSTDREKLDELVAISGRRSVPVIVVDKIVMVGFDKDMLEKALDA